MPYHQAHLCSIRYANKKVYCFPVKVTFGEIAVVTQQNIYPKDIVFIHAYSAREARDHIADKLCHIPCVEIEVYGPKGGIASHCYHGYDTAIFHQMLNNSEENRQQQLNI
jgi:hypothetical protein